MKYIASLLCFLFFYSPVSSEEFPAIVKDYHVKTIYEDGKVLQKVRMSILIQSKEGADYVVRIIPLDSYSKIKEIQGYLEDHNGKKIKKLKKEDVFTKSNPTSGTLYSDHLISYFYLEHNEYPFTVHYEYEVEKKQFLYIDYWYPFLYDAIPNEYSSFELWVNDTIDIRIKELNIDHVEPTKNEEYYVYHWEFTDLKAQKESESYMPVNGYHLPYVYIVPRKFNYEIDGSFESWNSFGKFKAQLNSGLHDLPQSELDRIDVLLEGIDDRKEKIEALYQYTQDETRHVNITIEEGGYKAYPASYVVENRFGDCKAFSNYFQALLKHIDIPSFYSSIYSGSENKYFIKDFPSQQFNGIILYLPEDSMWVDPTSQYGCGYVGTWIQNQYALVCNSDSSFLLKTPALEKEDVENYRLIYIKEFSSNNAELKVKNVYRGEMYELVNGIYKTYNSSKKVELFRDYFIEDKILAPEKINITHLTDESCMVLDYKTYSKSILQNVGDETLIEIPTFYIPVIERVKYRDYDVQIQYPYHYTDKIIIEKNNERRVIQLPESEEYITEFGEYIVNVTEDKKHIVIEKEYYLKRNYISKDNYEGFRNFLQNSRKIDSKINIRLSNTQ